MAMSTDSFMRNKSNGPGAAAGKQSSNGALSTDEFMRKFHAQAAEPVHHYATMRPYTAPGQEKKKKKNEKEKTTLGDVLSNPMYYAEKAVSAPFDVLQSGLKDIFGGTKKQEERLSANQQMPEAATPSKAKLVEGMVVKGGDQAVSGITATLDWLIGNPLKALGWESNPISEWNKYTQTNKEANEVYYAKNLANGSKAQKIVDEYGSATVAAIPQAIVAMMTAGSSLGAQGAGALTAGGTQLAGTEAAAAASAAMNSSKVAGAAKTVRDITTAMAKDKNYWASFAQVAGQGYQDAKADGASEWEANMFALANGIGNAAIEVGGGIQTLPVELRAGKKGLRAWITSAAEEGQEEVVQGVLERALQNLVYDRGNPIASVSDENAVLNPVTAAKEFAGGLVVGGVLGGGQTAIQKAMTATPRAVSGVRSRVEGQTAIDTQTNYSLVELGLNYAEGSKSRAMAEDIAKRLDSATSITESGVTAKDYGKLLRTMQSEPSARPDLSSRATTRVVSQEGQTVTQMGPVAEAFRAQGEGASAAVQKAQVLERMMSGEPVSNKQLESLDMRSKSTQAVLTQLTGMEVPQNATNSQLRKVFREAAKSAVDAKTAAQELARSVTSAEVAIEKAQANNAAQAEAEAATLMENAQNSVAEADAADPGVMTRAGQYVSREDFREYVQDYFKARGREITPEQADALYDRMKQYNTDNGPLLAQEQAKEGNAQEAANAFSVDTNELPIRETGTATKEQQWTARYVQDTLKNLGVREVVFDGAHLGSANAMIADGKIYLNESRLSSQRMIVWAVGHELVHPGAKADVQLVSTILGAFDTLSKNGALTPAITTQVDDLNALIAEKKGVYRRYLVNERGMSQEQADRTVTDDYVREEIAADWMGEVFADQNALEQLAGIEPKLMTRVLRALARVKTQGETQIVKGGETAEDATKRLDGLEQRLKSALERAGKDPGTPARPNPESVDTAGKTGYNETVDTTPEPTKASAELQDVMDRLAKGEDVSLDEINRTPEVEEVHKLPSTNTADIHTPEREQLRTEVLEKLYKRGSYSSETHDYTGEIAHNRRIDIVIGAPAAGKSSVLVNPLSEEHKSRVIDSDDAKAELPEYNKGKGAGSVHRESSDIRNRLLDRAVDNGENIVWPTVGDKLNKLLADIRTMKDNGYSVYLHLNELSAGKATGRALGRYLSEGRFVDPEVVLNVGDKPTQNYEYIRQQEGLIDGYSHYSNDVPRGEKPILIERSSETGRDVGGVLRETDAGGAERLVRRRSGRLSEAARGETAEAADTGAGRYSIDSPDYRGREDTGRADRTERRAGAALDEDAARARGDGSRDLAVHGRELTEAVRRRATERDVPNLGLRETTDYQTYSEALDAARTANRNGAMVDPQSTEELTEHGARTFLNADNTAGVAVEQDGNIVGVFKNPSNRTRRAAQDLLLNAIAAGGDHLDCYVLQPEVSPTNLGYIYSQLGFEPVAYLRFNREYADPNWDYASFGEPDVVMWVHNGDPVGTVVERIGNYPDYTPEEIRETCKEFTDYDEAKAYQKEQLNMRKTAQASEDAGAVSVLNEPSHSVVNTGDERFSVDSDTQADLDRLLDSEDFQAFFDDFFSGYSANNTGAPAETTQRVSRVRANTLEQANREHAAQVLGEERGKAIGRILTMDEKRLDTMSPEQYTYDVETEKQSMARAKERLTQNYEQTKAELERGTWRSGEDLDAAMGVLAAELAEARKTGNYESAVEWTHLIQEQGTGAGQFIHAFAKYTRSPEGVLVRAAETLDKANVPPAKRDQLLDKIADFTKTLSAVEAGDKDSMIQLILDQAEVRNTKVSKTTRKNLGLQKFEYLYDAALNQMDQIAKDYEKASVGKKLGTYQTISHLLNLKTGSRNLVSNQVFDIIGTLANDAALVPDAIIGQITGRRTVGLEKGWVSKGKRQGFGEGLRRGWIEASLDINPDAANARDKYGTARRTWKMTGNKGARTMSTLEKAMGFELNVADEFHKGSVTGETLDSLARAVERGDITQEEAAEWARDEALYRSFQDDTWIGGQLSNLKNLFNTVGIGNTGKKLGKINIKEFGLGDLVQKYTQVPGALMTRAIEFGPTGYLKFIYNAAQLHQAVQAEKQASAKATDARAKAEAKPDSAILSRRAARAKAEAELARKAANRAQRQAALSCGRAMTGTGLLALFATLAKSGLLKRADDEDDADAKALKASEGISGTQLNVSALGRLIEGKGSNWQQGDTLMSVEFLEPLNAIMTLGAMIAKDTEGQSGGEAVLTELGDTADALWQSMMELPTMQTLQTIQSTIQYHNDDSALGLWAEVPFEVARGSITGFIPSPVRQAAQAGDTVYRETYGDKNPLRQAGSTLQNSIPGKRNELDPKLNNFGQEKKLESTTRNVLNAFLNPGSLRTYRQSDVSRELDRVYQATGEANVYPDRSAPYTVTYTQNGESYKATPNADERQQYQLARGRTTYQLMQQSMNDAVYKSLAPEDQGEVLNAIKLYSNYVAKQEYLKAQGVNYTSATYEKYKEALQTGMTLAQYLTAKDAVNAATGDIDPSTGKAKSGTKIAEEIEIINGLDLTPEQKDYLLYSSHENTKKKVPWR